MVAASGMMPAVITIVVRPVIPGAIIPGAVVIPGIIVRPVPGIPVAVIAVIVPAVGIIPGVPINPGMPAIVIVTPGWVIVPGGVRIGIVPRPRRRISNGDNRIGRRKTYGLAGRNHKGVPVADNVSRGIFGVGQKVVYGII